MEENRYENICSFIIANVVLWITRRRHFETKGEREDGHVLVVSCLSSGNKQSTPYLSKFLKRSWVIFTFLSNRTIVFIFIVIFSTLRLVCPSAFLWCFMWKLGSPRRTYPFQIYPCLLSDHLAPHMRFPEIGFFFRQTARHQSHLLWEALNALHNFYETDFCYE